MDEQQRWLSKLDVANAAKIGQMQHGEFLSLGVSSGYIFNIQCYASNDYDWLLYHVDMQRYGYTVDDFGSDGIGLAQALDLYADACTTDFD